MNSLKQIQKLIVYNRKIKERQHSQSIIPSKQQADNRQQALIKIHRNSERARRKSLESVVRQNYRLYLNINNQQSSYKNLFINQQRKSQRKYSMACQQIVQQTPKEPIKLDNLQFNKIGKWIEKINSNPKEYKKRYSFRPILRERNNLSTNTNCFTSNNEYK